LEELASFIGQLGLGAGLLAFGALASQYSWQKFVVEGQSWDWSFAPDYLRFLIIAITILVCIAVLGGSTACMSASLHLSSCCLKASWFLWSLESDADAQCSHGLAGQHYNCA